jgi:hypothetical protein
VFGYEALRHDKKKIIQKNNNKKSVEKVIFITSICLLPLPLLPPYPKPRHKKSSRKTTVKS